MKRSEALLIIQNILMSDPPTERVAEDILTALEEAGLTPPPQKPKLMLNGMFFEPRIWDEDFT